jgi:RraA family protein
MAGYVVVRDFPRPAAEVFAALKSYPPALLSDVIKAPGAPRRVMDAAIRPLSADMVICGPALTVEAHPADNLMMHAALSVAKPGDVLVVNGGGDLSAALIGGILATQAKAAGIAGLVIDGAIRDVAEIVELGLAAFCRGVTPVGPTRAHPGRVGVPVVCGGVAVAPGDLVVADRDGVLIIPAAMGAGLAEKAAAKVEQEQLRLAEISAGKLVPGWLADALAKAGVVSG